MQKRSESSLGYGEDPVSNTKQKDPKNSWFPRTAGRFRWIQVSELNIKNTGNEVSKDKLLNSSVVLDFYPPCGGNHKRILVMAVTVSNSGCNRIAQNAVREEREEEKPEGQRQSFEGW